MLPYSNGRGNSGVRAYQPGAESIEVEFVDGSAYLYDWGKPGRLHVEAMKRLAAEGGGLTTYISQHVRARYAAKLR